MDILVYRNYRIGLHSHDFFEVNLVTKGSGYHFIGPGRVELRPGDTFVIPPGVRHAYLQTSGLVVYHLLLHPDLLTEYREKLSGLEGFFTLFSVEPYFQQQGVLRYGTRLAASDFREIRTRMDMLLEERKSAKPGGSWLQELMVLEIIVRLCRAHAEAFGAERDFHSRPLAVTTALRKIYEKHGVGITLDGLAEAACLERSYFCRLFHRATGMTPLETARREQLREGQRRLRSSDQPIGILAFELGFCDAAHFSRAFHREFGISPLEFRKKGQL